jgi:hypothetical protein
MCIFNIPLKDFNLNNLLNLGIEEAKLHGGTVNGTTTNGEFFIPALGGIFQGVYRTGNNFVEIKLDKKPFLVPCKLIESFLQQHIK